jgi:hypothetical protein
MARGVANARPKRLRRWTPISDLDIGIQPRTLQRWCKEGKIRAQKFGGQWFLYLPELERLFGQLDTEQTS